MAETILFFGNERLATGVTTPVLTLQALLAAGYDVPAVVVAQAGQPTQSHKDRTLEIEGVASEHGIPILAPAKLNEEALDKLKSYKAEAAVLVSYGNLLPQEVIDIFPKGIINIHPSLLPKHRGPTPIEGAILAGDKETGVSLMKLVAAMDAGPVYAQETVLLHGQETKQQLADQLLGIGANMLVQYLPDILNGKLAPTPQDDTQATPDKRITKENGRLDFYKPAVQLEREVRAHAVWPKSRVMVAGSDLIITRAHVVEGNGLPGTVWLSGKSFGVHCKEGILAFDTLIPPGKKEMTVEAYLAGYQVA